MLNKNKILLSLLTWSMECSAWMNYSSMCTRFHFCMTKVIKCQIKSRNASQQSPLRTTDDSYR